MTGLTTERAACVLFFALTLASAFCSANRDERSKRPSRSLSAEVINSTTITLKWPAPAATTADGVDCPVRRYLIRLKHQGVKRVRTWKVEDGNRLSVSLHGLMADTTYNVRLVVVNCEGRSKPSRWVVVRTSSSALDHGMSFRISTTGGGEGGGRGGGGGHSSETSAPGQPRKVASKAFADYVIVSWEPPEDGAEVRGYVIGYGEGVPDVNWQYLEGHRRNVTVKNLKKLTQYVISVRAFNNVGKGPVVYDLVYTRDTPSQASGSLPAPTNLRSKVLSPTTIWLQWSDASLGRQQTVTDNRYYNVHYQSTNNGNDKTVVVKELHVVLYNLLPATTYEFKVGLVKDGLTSAFSEVVVNRTMESAPSSPPRSVTVTRLSSDPSTAIVSWRSPKQTNGNITDYTIYYTLNVELPYERWQTANIRQRTEFALQGLNDSVTYYFRVQARNSVGPGPKSDIVKYDTRTTPVIVQGPTRGPQLTTDGDTGSRHVIALNETEEDEYDYTETDKDDDKGGEGGILTASLVHETSHGGDSAQAGKMKREPNLGPFLTDVTTTTTSDPDDAAPGGDPSRPHPVVQFRVVLSHRINAYVTWPETPGDCVSPGAPRRALGYRLRYRRADEAGEYVTRSLSQNLALIDDLAPNTKYRYQVKYVMENEGETAWSGENELDTSLETGRRN